MSNIDYYLKIKEKYSNYSDAPSHLKQDPVFAREALLECIRQCNEIEEEHRRKIYSAFSKYVSLSSKIHYTITTNDGPRVVEKNNRLFKRLIKRIKK